LLNKEKWIRLLPDRSRRNSDDNVDGRGDTGKGAATKDDIKHLASRSREIRSKIDNLINESSLLLELDNQLQKGSKVTDEKQVNSDGKLRTDPLELNTTNRNNVNISKYRILDINRRLVKLNEEFASINELIISSSGNIIEKYEKQNDFINIAAHEIRSPCQAIIGHIELLYLEPVNSKKYLDLIANNAERLSLLISNILDASRIDHKTLQIKKEKFSLVKLIEQIIDDLNSRITNDNSQDAQIVFENIQTDIQKTNDTNNENKSIVVSADKGRITQVIFNLLDNAIRFSRENKIIVTLKKGKPIQYKVDKNISGFEGKEETVRLPEQEQLNQREIIVQVKDTGRGIDSKVLDNLFSKFTSDTTTGGTGLGLFISKNIIEAHGGRIWAENNKEHKGATFSFSLPWNLD
jgi:signal transduction histidine kinase